MSPPPQQELTHSPVLVAIDFSPSANEALRQAASRAKALDTTLVLFHVVYRPLVMPQLAQFSGTAVGAGEEKDVAAELTKRLHALAAEHIAIEPPRIRVEIAFSPTPYAEIVAKAEQLGAQLVVVGHRGRVGFSRLLLGSVAQRVARSCPCPVLIARPAPGTKRMLVTTDFSEASRRGVEHAAREAQLLGFQVTLYHNLELPSLWWSTLAPLGPIPPQLDQQTIDQLNDTARQLLRDELSRVNVDGEAVVGTGASADEAIVRLADERAVDLIVMASHGHSAIARLALGSVTESVLLHAHCSVLAVPEG